MRTLIAFGCFLSLVAKLAAGPAEEPGREAIEHFEKIIRPVLVERCYTCHSAQAEKVKSGLFLDTREGLLKGGDRGPAIVPGDPDRSRLIRAIRYSDENLKMPPKKRLSPQQVADFEAWVKRGAPDPRTKNQVSLSDSDSARAKEHWAFKAPKEPQLPLTKEQGWQRNPIDNFILAKLEAEGMKPSPPADKRTLLRRASFDLIGLPPTPEVIDAFLADNSPDAFAHVIDRLLASPHYGERWGRHWLDVARYADTKGTIYYEEVRFVHSWAYRDWVIRAFNEDLPYDQFILQQLAADQLLGVGQASKTAGPESRFGNQTHDPWPLAAMGFLTVGRRFYGLVPEIIDDRIDIVGRGLLGLTVGCARCHNHKYDPIPTLDYYSLYGVFAGSAERVVPLVREPKHGPEVAAYEKELQAREQKFQKALKEALERVADGARKITDQYLVALLEMDKLLPEEVYIDFPEDKFNDLVARYWESYLDRIRNEVHPVFAPWHAYAALSPQEFRAKAPAVLPSMLNKTSSASLTPARSSLGKGEIVGEGVPRLNAKVVEAFASPPASMREVAERYGKLFVGIDSKWRQALDRAKKEKLAVPKSLEDPAEEELRQVLYGEDSPLNFPIRTYVDIGFLLYEDVMGKLGQLQKEVDELRIASDAAPPHAYILVDRPMQRNPRVFKRGKPEQKGEGVPRQFLSVLAGPNRKPFAHGSGRLELARAIASADNPLTARVLVNRVWMHHFGQGLVRTPSDFGLRGDPPSHPELLDWLARRFVEGGWSIKKLHKLILCSSAYQQSSQDNAAYRQRDPDNRLLWRMSGRRLDFEAMRDALLTVAGELDSTMGGRQVYLEYEPFSGRRTVYGFVERTNPPSVFATFDFANADTHSPQRHMTTVPQQVLYLMNGRFADQQARRLVQRCAGEAEPARRIEQMYRLVFGRTPSEEELKLGLDFLRNAQTQPRAATASPQQAWSYGYGSCDPATGKPNFTPLPYFVGESWKIAAHEPDPVKGRAFLTAKGGHPGTGPQHGVIRRWTAPRDGSAVIRGILSHKEEGTGKGITARIVSSRHGVIASWTVRKLEADTNLKGLQVQRGDTLDFLVDGRKDSSGDSFAWAPVIELAEAGKKPDAGPMPVMRWDAATDFSGPVMGPPNAWEKYAHVLLMSNEFMFVN
jgi:hypothetical protein